jgi:hypothetical protein
MKALDLFPVVVYQSKISNNDELKEMMLSDIVQDSKSLKVPKGWAAPDSLKTSWGNDIHDVLDKHKSELYSSYTDCFDEIFDKEYEIKVKNTWFNVYEEGASQELHDHITNPNWLIRPDHFSCVHFLSYDKSVHTPLEFSDPIQATRSLSPSLSRDYVSEYASLDVSEGDFLMFPCYLQHRVKPQKVSDIPRVTISFNIRLSQYGDNVEHD